MRFHEKTVEELRAEIAAANAIDKEQNEATRIFANMLAGASADGSKKRAAGTKVPWQFDREHEAAIFSHLNKWKHGELEDADSGQHPLVHLAWRALAIAWQETHREEKERIRKEWDDQRIREAIMDAFC